MDIRTVLFLDCDALLFKSHYHRDCISNKQTVKIQLQEHKELYSFRSYKPSASDS